MDRTACSCTATRCTAVQAAALGVCSRRWDVQMLLTDSICAVASCLVAEHPYVVLALICPVWSFGCAVLCCTGLYCVALKTLLHVVMCAHGRVCTCFARQSDITLCIRHLLSHPPLRSCITVLLLPFRSLLWCLSWHTDCWGGKTPKQTHQLLSFCLRQLLVWAALLSLCCCYALLLSLLLCSGTT